MYMVPLFSTSFAVNPVHSAPSIVSNRIQFAVVESLSLPILHLFQFTRSRLESFRVLSGLGTHQVIVVLVVTLTVTYLIVIQNQNRRIQPQSRHLG